ncbi:DUF4214 domain-containing protein [Antarcticirhabdus aurantiaca]|uniref:DUF4214 domain-containing protein n=1 Tax=Antarcticirhabdus aurantiaca TaxID=2606717 RepID=A0ACD4NJB4_9HYPH|nr:DUF4214 domain-containing protein [Jeongeuplla avenae]
MATIDTIRQYYADILQLQEQDPITGANEIAARAGEIQSYASAVDSGALTLAQARAALIASPEGQDVQDVVRLYQVVFGRVPDKAGLNFQVDKLRGPANEQNVAEGLGASPEFAARFGGNTVNTAFINAVYQQVLGRTPSAGEVQFYLDSGFSAARIALAFSEAPEFRGRADGATEQFLNDAALGTETYNGPLLGGDVVPAPTLTLRAGVETATGSTGDDVISGVISITGGNDSGTFNTGDNINGGAGNDTLSVIAANAATIVPASLTNVETVRVQDLSAGATINMANATGVQTLAVGDATVGATTSFTNVGNLVDIEVSNSNAAGGTGSNIAVTYAASAVAGTADVQDIALNNARTTITANGIETANVVSTGTNTVSLALGTTLSTINASGAGSAAFGTLSANVTTFNGTSATGALSADFSSTGNVAVTGGSANDTFSFGTSLTAVATGVAGDVVNGGDGFDTVRVTTPGNLQAAAAAAPFNTLVSVEKVAFDGAGVTLNGATFTNTGITNIEFNTTGADTINNAGSARTYEFGALNTGDATFAMNGTSTALNIDLLGTAGTAATSGVSNTVEVGALTVELAATQPATAVSAITLSSLGNFTANSIVAGNELSLTAGAFNSVGEVTARSGSTVTIDGAAALDVAGFTNNVTVNSSALTGNLVIQGSAIVGGNEGDATAATVLTQGFDTFTLGSGRDVIQFAADGSDSGIIQFAATATPGTFAANGNILVDVINGFTAGANGDVLDAAGAAATFTALAPASQTSINALSGAGATLVAAADLAATGNTGAGWTAFTFQGQTYALYEAAADNTAFDNTDTLVQLSGVNLADLTAANFA